MVERVAEVATQRVVKEEAPAWTKLSVAVLAARAQRALSVLPPLFTHKTSLHNSSRKSLLRDYFEI